MTYKISKQMTKDLERYFNEKVDISDIMYDSIS